MGKPNVEALGFFDEETQEGIASLVSHLLAKRSKAGADQYAIPSLEELSEAAGSDQGHIDAIVPTMEYFKLLQLTASAGYDGAELPVFN